MSEGWVNQAACRGANTSEFFIPAGGRVPQHVQQRCADCPVRQPCADYAIADRSIVGYWGGLSEKERRTERSRRRKSGQLVTTHGNLKPIVHGTNAGYQAHRRREEDPCDECRVARSDYLRAQRTVAA